MQRSLCKAAGNSQHSALAIRRCFPVQNFNHTCRRSIRSQRGPLTIFAQGRALRELLSLTRESKNPARLKPGNVSPELEVPAHIPRPPYVATKGDSGHAREYQTHDQQGVEKMRAAGKLAAQVLQHAGTLVKPGVTTDFIDKAVHKMIVENGAYPSPLGYGAFPKSVCTSVNECLCHGIPDDRPLQEGDIINIDVTVYLNGYHGDTSAMFYVGEVSPEARRLCEVTKRCMDAAIAECKPGLPVKQIGATVQKIADKEKLKVVRAFCGHGVGWVFHSAPLVQHAKNHEPGVLIPWMTFTIEPILSMGSTNYYTWKDDWTAVTNDGSLTAQWEHTILITPTGYEILTLP